MIDLYGLASPLLRCLAPEAAHGLTLWALRSGLIAPTLAKDAPALGSRVFGLNFPNPLGLAAGFDKNVEAVAPLLSLKLGFVEVGGITPNPQPGNPKPRVFRLGKDEAVINRLGFNCDGLEAAVARLAALWRQPYPPERPIGANLALNRTAEDPAEDYIIGLSRLYDLIDYATLNVSSPNTPGLRALQGREPLSDLLARVLEARERAGELHGKRLPVLVKIAPDLSGPELADIVGVALSRGVDGLVVTNTTTGHREGLKSRHRIEAGGLSGRPLFAPSTRMLKETYRLTDGRLPLIGVGGIASGADAYAKIRSGASLVQLYTALVFHGPELIERIKSDLAGLLIRDGFTNLAQAVGADLKS